MADYLPITFPGLPETVASQGTVDCDLTLNEPLETSDGSKSIVSALVDGSDTQIGCVTNPITVVIDPASSAPANQVAPIAFEITDVRQDAYTVKIKSTIQTDSGPQTFVSDTVVVEAPYNPPPP